ncbi:uncharacterized protein Z518_10870 [Rhinocladiella mackenziei CBS 650.93]|uniref:RING-type domain-containing protein n=1 Tax=Rhinocladiella mackenziei CBS 650.93 TaxID=1442369 RepID=A0A0D2GNK6_9EURO|nr:uncharacterized protein Z518_10870 [Rhinocladiella mackenziei CBS 650.93]KIW99942.1 hypothetical protein Z518_10870 [Rhinocladiella mackenziei CBS 650.93]
MADDRRLPRERDAALTYRSPCCPGPVIEISDDDDDDEFDLRHPRPRVPAYLPTRHRRRNISSVDSVSRYSDSVDDEPPFSEEARHSHTFQVHKRVRTGPDLVCSPGQIATHHSGSWQAASAPSSITPGAGPLYHETYRSRPPQNQVGKRPTESGQPNGRTIPNPPTKTAARPEKKKAAHQPPYYVDGRFGVKMYRGPGYERFPVVLGTVRGHKEYCDRWDIQQTFKMRRKLQEMGQGVPPSYVIRDSDSESHDDAHSNDDILTLEKECLRSVLEVFPDIEHSFVMKKIQAHPAQPTHFDDDDDDELIPLGAPPLAENIIAEIVEMESYPKQRLVDSAMVGRAAADDGTGATVTWDKNLPKGDVYKKDAVILLSNTFAHVPTCYIFKVVEEKNSIFDAYVHIHAMEDQFYSLPSPRPYNRLRQPRLLLEKKYVLGPQDRRIPNEYAHRINELQAAKQHVVRETIQIMARKAKDEAEASNLAKHRETGAIIECQCCFDGEVPLNRVVSCTADRPHFFCFTCVEGLADNQVGLMRYEMMCMDASGCTSELSNEGIARAVPTLTFDRLELNKQQAEIVAAGIEGLEGCPFCEYKAVCEDVREEPLFYCQNPDCSRATCRKCHKDNHLPKTCEENAKDNVLSARHLVEEARSDAVMRTCPKCKVKIIKEFGCNKMMCSQCACIMCYECKEDISSLGGNPYHHFNRPGAKCSLYDQEGIVRHDQEANQAEKEAIDKAKAADANLDEDKLRIDTGQEKKPTLADHPAADVFYRDMNNRAARLNNRQRELQNMMTRYRAAQELRPNPALEAAFDQIHRVGEQRENHFGDLRKGVEDLRRLNEIHRQAVVDGARLDFPPGFRPRLHNPNRQLDFDLSGLMPLLPMMASPGGEHVGAQTNDNRPLAMTPRMAPPMIQPPAVGAMTPQDPDDDLARLAAAASGVRRAADILERDGNTPRYGHRHGHR